jgi:hypothetical protein
MLSSQSHAPNFRFRIELQFRGLVFVLWLREIYQQVRAQGQRSDLL